MDGLIALMLITSTWICADPAASTKASISASHSACPVARTSRKFRTRDSDQSVLARPIVGLRSNHVLDFGYIGKPRALIRPNLARTPRASTTASRHDAPPPRLMAAIEMLSDARQWKAGAEPYRRDVRARTMDHDDDRLAGHQKRRDQVRNGQMEFNRTCWAASVAERDRSLCGHGSVRPVDYDPNMTRRRRSTGGATCCVERTEAYRLPTV